MKSLPAEFCIVPMREEPPEWVKDFGWSIFTPDGHISGRGIDNGLPCEMAFKLPYRPGEKCYVREAWLFLDYGRFCSMFASFLCLPETITKFGYEDCPDARWDFDGVCTTDLQLSCPVEGGCNDNGKVLKPWAKLAKETPHESC